MALKLRQGTLRGPGSSSVLRGGITLAQPAIASNTSVFSTSLNHSIPGSVITQTGVTRTPTTTLALYAPFIGSNSSAFAPSLATTISPGLVSQLGTVSSPSLARVLYADQIGSNTQTFEPSIEDKQYVLATLIENLGHTYGPSLLGVREIDLPFIDSTGTVSDPSLALGVYAELSGYESQVFDPAFAWGVRPTVINTEAFLEGTMLTPSIGSRFAFPSIASQTSVFGPSAKLVLTNGFIESSTSIFSGHLASTVSISRITQLGTVSSPSFGWGLSPNLIASSPTVFETRFATPIYFGLIGSNVQALAPGVYKIIPGKATGTVRPSSYALGSIRYPSAIAYIRKAPSSDEVL